MTARRLSICHLAKYYPPALGGIETHVQTLARAQASLGSDVSVVCINHLDEAARDTSWRRIPCTHTHEESDEAVRVTRIGRWLALAKFDFCRRLRAAIAPARSANIVHVHCPNPTMLWAVAHFCRQSTIIITHHSDVVRQRALKCVLRPLENYAYSKAYRILSSSPAYIGGSALLQKYQDKTTCVPLGLDLNQYMQPNSATLLCMDRLQPRLACPSWLAVGRCVYYKGLQSAIRALAMVPGRLIIVGNGPEQAGLRALAEDVGVQDRIDWWGYATPNELAALYHLATALWFPSNARSEGFGLVQVEAMASGCPVINTSIPHSGVSWVSQHEATGLTIPMNDPAALASASRRIVEEPGLRSRLSAGARARAIAEFDHKVMAIRTFDVYEAALAEREHARNALIEVATPIPSAEYEAV